MAGLKLAVLFGGLAFAVAGCSEATRGKGVTIPPEESNQAPSTKTVEDSVNISIRNLTFDKERRTLIAAQNLARKGAESVKAVPYLKEYSTMETNSEGFPSDTQRAEFKKALESIENDAKQKGIPIPTEKAPIDDAPPATPAATPEEKK